MDVIVEPGIGWMELNEYLEPYGLFFPLDPGLYLLILNGFSDVNGIYPCDMTTTHFRMGYIRTSSLIKGFIT